MPSVLNGSSSSLKKISLCMLELALKRYKLLVVYFDSYTIPSGMMLVIYSIVFSRTGLSPQKWKSSVRRALMKIDCRDWGIEI